MKASHPSNSSSMRQPYPTVYRVPQEVLAEDELEDSGLNHPSNSEHYSRRCPQGVSSPNSQSGTPGYHYGTFRHQDHVTQGSSRPQKAAPSLKEPFLDPTCAKPTFRDASYTKASNVSNFQGLNGSVKKKQGSFYRIDEAKAIKEPSVVIPKTLRFPSMQDNDEEVTRVSYMAPETSTMKNAPQVASGMKDTSLVTLSMIPPRPPAKVASGGDSFRLPALDPTDSSSMTSGNIFDSEEMIVGSPKPEQKLKAIVTPPPPVTPSPTVAERKTQLDQQPCTSKPSSAREMMEAKNRVGSYASLVSLDSSNGTGPRIQRRTFGQRGTSTKSVSSSSTSESVKRELFHSSISTLQQPPTTSLHISSSLMSNLSAMSNNTGEDSSNGGQESIDSCNKISPIKAPDSPKRRKPKSVQEAMKNRNSRIALSSSGTPASNGVSSRHVEAKARVTAIQRMFEEEDKMNEQVQQIISSGATSKPGAVPRGAKTANASPVAIGIPLSTNDDNSSKVKRVTKLHKKCMRAPMTPEVKEHKSTRQQHDEDARAKAKASGSQSTAMASRIAMERSKLAEQGAMAVAAVSSGGTTPTFGVTRMMSSSSKKVTRQEKERMKELDLDGTGGANAVQDDEEEKGQDVEVECESAVCVEIVRSQDERPVAFPGAFAVEGMDTNHENGSQSTDVNDSVTTIEDVVELNDMDSPDLEEGTTPPFEAVLAERELFQGAVVDESEDIEKLDPKLTRCLRCMVCIMTIFTLGAIALVAVTLVLLSQGDSAGAATILTVPPLKGWKRIGGEDITSPNKEAQMKFGSALAFTKTGELVVVAPGADLNTEQNVGMVYVFQQEKGPNTTEWKALHEIHGLGSAKYASASLATSSDGSQVAVGYPHCQGGQVQMLSMGNEDVKEDVLVNHSNESSWFGYDIDLSSDGSILAVGAPRTSSRNGKQNGSVMIYKKMKNNTWEQMGPAIEGTTSGDFFGWTVALSSNGLRVAIGSPIENEQTGAVRVFDWNQSSWVQIGEPLRGMSSLNRFGDSLGLSSDGNILAVGARGTMAESSGYVQAFQDVKGTWEKFGSAIKGTEDGEGFGTAVSLSGQGDVIAIGSPKNSEFGDSTGRVQVLEFNTSSHEWNQLGSDIHGTADQAFGSTVAVSFDGSTIAGGSPTATFDGKIPSAGSVSVFQTMKHMTE